jgi:cyclopropane-fatty-acyl-phospholipid synthase
MSTPNWINRFGRQQVDRLLGNWQVGQLEVTWPDGSNTQYGSDPSWQAKLHIHRDEFFGKLLFGGEVGFGEAYVDGHWDTPDLPGFLALINRNLEDIPIDGAMSILQRLRNMLRHRGRSNTRRGSRKNIHAHYDLSNEMFALFLDETMTYSSAVFENNEQSLADAQRNKYARLAASAGIRAEHHVLEIGCGWGGFAIWAASNLGCRVTGITLSEAQRELALERVRSAGLSDRIEIQICDYRDLEGTFDRIVSIEMFEAVGSEHWPDFFRACEEHLAEDGRVAMQMITLPDYRVQEYRSRADWIQEYIFPGGELAAVGHVCKAAASASRLGLHHLSDIGVHYAETLSRWRHTFLARIHEVQSLGFDQRFIRIWDYYLASCQAMFAQRSLSTVQILLTRPGNHGLPGIPGHSRAAAA